MFIKNRDEALDALAEIVDLPERRSQIIRCTVAIMQCLDADPRSFMYDCQVLLIEGGLETLKQKRRVEFEKLSDGDLLVVVDPEENKEFEAIASSFDALRLSDIVREVFPAVTTRYQSWEVARAMLGDEAAIQEQILAALRARNAPGGAAAHDLAFRRVTEIIEGRRPEWHPQSVEILQACLAVARDDGLGDGSAEEAQLLFSVVAVDDARAASILEALRRDPGAAVEELRRIHELVAALQTMEKQAQEQSKNVA
jgi:hypothetical protein